MTFADKALTYSAPIPYQIVENTRFRVPGDQLTDAADLKTGKEQLSSFWVTNSYLNKAAKANYAGMRRSPC